MTGRSSQRDVGAMFSFVALPNVVAMTTTAHTHSRHSVSATARNTESSTALVQAHDVTKAYAAGKREVEFLHGISLSDLQDEPHRPGHDAAA